jgi:hypothetical protein
MPTALPGRAFAAHHPYLVLFCALAACKGPRLAEELPANESHRAAEQNAPAAGDHTTTLPLAPGAPGERPSVDRNMGRGFQGVLAVRIHQASGQSQDLRYLNLGNTARLQIDTLGDTPRRGAPLHFDALIWGESISVLDHQRRSVRTLPLGQIRARSETETPVTIRRTGERSNLQGVFCERFELQQAELRVDACVASLPGTFAVDELETVSGLDVPAWVEQLLKEELMPLRASVRDAAGKERYSLELMQYAPGPVDASMLGVPENYTPENPRTLDGALGSIGR